MKELLRVTLKSAAQIELPQPKLQIMRSLTIPVKNQEPVRHKQFRLQLPLFAYAIAPLNLQVHWSLLVSRCFGSASKSSISS